MLSTIIFPINGTLGKEIKPADVNSELFHSEINDDLPGLDIATSLKSTPLIDSFLNDINLSHISCDNNYDNTEFFALINNHDKIKQIADGKYKWPQWEGPKTPKSPTKAPGKNLSGLGGDEGIENSDDEDIKEDPKEKNKPSITKNTPPILKKDTDTKPTDKKTIDKKSIVEPDKPKPIDYLSLQKNNPIPNGPYIGCGFRFDVLQDSSSKEISIKINEIFSPEFKRFFIPPNNKTFLNEDILKSLNTLEITDISIGDEIINLTELFRDKTTIQAMEELIGMLHDSGDIIFTGRDSRGNLRKFGCCRDNKTVFVTKEYEAPEVKKYFENKPITGAIYNQAEHGTITPESIDKFIKLNANNDLNNKIIPNSSTKITNGDELNKKITDALNKPKGRSS